MVTDTGRGDNPTNIDIIWPPFGAMKTRTFKPKLWAQKSWHLGVFFRRNFGMNGFGTRDNTQVEGRFVGFCGFWLVICGWWILDFAPPPPSKKYLARQIFWGRGRPLAILKSPSMGFFRPSWSSLHYESYLSVAIWVFPKIMVPQNGWWK